MTADSKKTCPIVISHAIKGEYGWEELIGVSFCLIQSCMFLSFVLPYQHIPSASRAVFAVTEAATFFGSLIYQSSVSVSYIVHYTYRSFSRGFSYTLAQRNIGGTSYSTADFLSSITVAPPNRAWKRFCQLLIHGVPCRIRRIHSELCEEGWSWYSGGLQVSFTNTPTSRPFPHACGINGSRHPRFQLHPCHCFIMSPSTVFTMRCCFSMFAPRNLSEAISMPYIEPQPPEMSRTLNSVGPNSRYSVSHILDSASSRKSGFSSFGGVRGVVGTSEDEWRATAKGNRRVAPAVLWGLKRTTGDALCALAAPNNDSCRLWRVCEAELDVVGRRRIAGVPVQRLARKHVLQSFLWLAKRRSKPQGFCKDINITQSQLYWSARESLVCISSLELPLSASFLRAAQPRGKIR